jgi:hypothetical protein
VAARGSESSWAPGRCRKVWIYKEFYRDQLNAVQAVGGSNPFVLTSHIPPAYRVA